MGRDKAALPFGETTLVEHVVAQLRSVRSAPQLAVTLIGAPERYGHLGLRAVADQYRNCGPLGGVCTALETTFADFNFIVACDMPGVTAEFFRGLIAVAEAAESGWESGNEVDCVIPETADSLHPLCAVYHRRVLRVAQQRIRSQSFKMHDFIASLHVLKFPVEKAIVENINTPVDWRSHERDET
jgi:molybdopterin-guanine dinucleotide biosynthesis protein A